MLSLFNLDYGSGRSATLERKTSLSDETKDHRTVLYRRPLCRSDSDMRYV